MIIDDHYYDELIRDILENDVFGKKNRKDIFYWYSEKADYKEELLRKLGLK